MIPKVAIYWTGAAPATGMTTNPPLKRNSRSCCLAILAKERTLEVVFVKLTNSFEFRGEKTLISVAEEVFSANTTAGFSYYDMDECVGRGIDLDNPESDSMFYFHPTAEGHRLFADCLSELITSANRQHAPQSH